ncbi:hypothetical protein L1987_16349 [Smallanthus sonchifolius]|uniref:Uncharacterized protein n=1 Tax=Smallanthus sonchifolius TaxID=185202 RepID=A0ACB9JAA7_9ASTR|nr:hypothetical protein L1987_16349 [Smallanthus sonchifolius]
MDFGGICSNGFDEFSLVFGLGGCTKRNVKHMQIPFHDISLATNRFADQNLLATGGLGKVYKGLSGKHGHIAVKRWDRGQGQGDHEFKTEIALLGFCDDKGEKKLVYKGSL